MSDKPVAIVESGVFLVNADKVVIHDPDYSPEQIARRLSDAAGRPVEPDEAVPARARQGTIAHGVLSSHDVGGDGDAGTWRLRFDALASHDITYVSIVQAARASGVQRFPLPYVLTNCHNSLEAVGGTINADDHAFGLSAAITYGGVYVPPQLAVIHQYIREMLTGGGRMILGSDSHTRYGSLGTMGVGEGGPELVKQLLQETYDLHSPQVIAVYLEGQARPGVGPQDVALAIIGRVFPTGFVRNKILEFVGPGIADLPVGFRNGIDVMTTETACLTSIWQTDARVEDYYRLHQRPDDFALLRTQPVAYYDGLVRVDLSRVEPMIALPFHPSKAHTITSFIDNAEGLLEQVEIEAREHFPESAVPRGCLTAKVSGRRVTVDQGIIAGCAGGLFENLAAAGSLLDGQSVGNGAFSLSAYPASQPVNLELIRTGVAEQLIGAGVIMHPAFCGPCFGAGEVPSNTSLSIRHTTRNFPSREGSRPADGQAAFVALMDARSIAATARNQGVLTPGTDYDWGDGARYQTFAADVYRKRVSTNLGMPRPKSPLRLGPSIRDWPEIPPLPEDLLLSVASVIRDPVTTTDELIPSGEISSYRSNPIRLAEFTLSRRDPGYLGRAKAAHEIERRREAILADGPGSELGEPVDSLLSVLAEAGLIQSDGAGQHRDLLKRTGFGSAIYATRPGDGSAREQAASSQRVLGGWANVAVEYATKRYRSNLIHWGILPLTVTDENLDLHVGDHLFLAGVRRSVLDGQERFTAHVLRYGRVVGQLELWLRDLAAAERHVLAAGSLINYNRSRSAASAVGAQP